MAASNKNLLYSVPGVEILRATGSKVYQSNLLPSMVSPEEIEWSRLGSDEEYNVILHKPTPSRPAKVQVILCSWNEANQDWDSEPVSDTTGLNLTVYLP